MKRLAGRRAVVTGAASGIGRAIAGALAAEGVAVVCVDVDGGVGEVADALGGVAERVDMRVAADVEALAERVRLAGGAQIVVNNAGVACRGAFAESSLEDLHHVLDVNLWGVIHGTHAFLPQLLAADEAHLVNISSVFGLLAVPGQASYCASKFAVRGLTEALALELAGTAVGVTVVHPGGIRTRIAARSRRAMSAPEVDSQHDAAIRWFERSAASPDRVARAVVNAIRNRRLRVLVPAEAVLIDLARRLAPTWANQAAAVMAPRLIR